MYIPEFWVGVIITLLCEVFIVVAACTWATWRNRDENDFHKSNK